MNFLLIISILCHCTFKYVEATNVSGELLGQSPSRSNCWFPIVHRTAPSSSTILPLAPLYLVLAI